MLADPERRIAMGERAAAVVHRHGDLPEHTAAALLGLLAGSGARGAGSGGDAPPDHGDAPPDHGDAPADPATRGGT
jgi:hypothetical protein